MGVVGEEDGERVSVEFVKVVTLTVVGQMDVVVQTVVVPSSVVVVLEEVRGGGTIDVMLVMLEE